MWAELDGVARPTTRSAVVAMGRSSSSGTTFLGKLIVVSVLVCLVGAHPDKLECAT